MVLPRSEKMVLPEEQNRRFAPKRKTIITIRMLSVVSFVIFLCLIGYLLFYRYNLSSNIKESSSPSGNLTLDQISFVNKLREELSGSFTQEYMKSSQFLMPWLIETDWDLEAARTMLIECLEWREENKIDGILDEDFSHISSEFPMYSDGVDREGRPVMSSDISVWDVRKASVTGSGKKFLRWYYYQNEFSAKFIRDAQSRGQNVSQSIILSNLDGFSMIQNACSNCIFYYVKMSSVLQDCYPGMVYKFIIINMPEEFEFFLSFALANFERNLKIYGRNKVEWKEAILRLISPDQIRPQFGGTKNSDMEQDE